MKYLNKGNLKKIKSLSKRYKPMDLYYKIREKMDAPYQDYHQKLDQYMPSQNELDNQIELQQQFQLRPLVSIVVPTYETDELFLKQMVDSCINQTYPNWQLCLADGSKSDKVEKTIVSEYSQEDRISYQRLLKNAGISENTNQGFAMAKGDYIALLDHDDLLTPNALFEMVKCVNETGADFVYSDEDKVSMDLNHYMEPHFKLDFNRELLLGNNYICHFLMVSREILQQAKGLDSRFDGAQDFDFVLRCSEFAKKIAHVPKVLYHWRVHAGSTAGNTDSKLYAYEAGKRAVEACLERKGWQGTVTMSNDLGFYRTVYQVPQGVSVNFIFREEKGNRFDKVMGQIKKELEKEGITIVDSQDADYTVVINRKIRKVSEKSVTSLLGSCAREGVEAVAARTVSRNKVVQCGYWSKDGKKSPRFVGLHKNYKGYFRRAYLLVEVDVLEQDLLVYKNGATGRKIVDPSVEVDIS